jgi:hypothetical protein
MSATEQCANIKFCVLLNKFPSETTQMLEVDYDIGNAGLHRHKHFCDDLSCRLEVFIDSQGLSNYKLIPVGCKHSVPSGMQ